MPNLLKVLYRESAIESWLRTQPEETRTDPELLRELLRLREQIRIELGSPACSWPQISGPSSKTNERPPRSASGADYRRFKIHNPIEAAIKMD
jgi:hypothetical protein